MSSRNARIGSVFAAFALAVSAASAQAPQASKPGDYAYQWPLRSEGDSAAWQFALTPEVYAVLKDKALGDLEVFNAQGQAVPVARMTIDPATQPGVAQVTVPAFPLPRATVAMGDDLSLRLERDDDGRLRSLQADVVSAEPQGFIDYVLDADVGRRPQRVSTVDRLDLHWPETGRDMRTRFAVDGSDDLEHWQPLVDAAAVISLRRDGAVLQRRDIVLPATALRYLRLRQLDGDALPSLQITARRTRAGAPPSHWRRLRAEFVDAVRDEHGGGQLYRYRLPALLPVGRIGVTLGADNATAEVTIDTRSEEAWLPVGRTLLFRLRQGEQRIDNEDMALTVPTAARELRLRSPIALNPAPVVEVSYLPDRFIFLAQGTGPYTLAAGSRNAHRPELPVEQALAPLRKQFGADWQPAMATLGARAVSAGDAAYAEPRKPFDWRNALLWALLIGGAVVVAGFALTLLRQKSTQRDGNA
ncbi:MAG: DUF3999 domain-containing protein [Lysobacteraceae bacterium]|nr:MAG: DUF3999 domain-containing protein [Xanthomonadaceae bacterium]